MVEIQQASMLQSADGQITQYHDEINSHFDMRKEVYQRALQDQKTPE